MPYNGIEREKDRYQIITLEQEHLEQIMELQSLVQSKLNDKDLCLFVSRDEFMAMLGDKGVVLGAVADDKLVGLCSVLFPGEHNPENLGKILDLPGDELARVGHLEIAFINPDYRGKGLYIQMTERIISTVRALNSVCHLCATIHPRNIPSLQNTMIFDMQIVKLNAMYGGLTRFILYRDLTQTTAWDDRNTITVESNDIHRQQQLLQSGWVGVRCIREGDTALIEYCKLATNGG